MIAIAFSAPITANGQYVFPALNPTQAVQFEVRGGFAGAAVKPGYDDGSGNFVPYTMGSGAISVTSADGWEVKVPASGKLALEVTGASAATISVSVINSRG